MDLVQKLSLEDVLVRKALLKTTKEERYAVLKESPGGQQLFLEVWNKGEVCGRCKSFSQLGGFGSGLNGMCGHKDVKKTEYTKPTEEGCRYFELTSAAFPHLPL
jgi:hypothetical protein